MARKETSNPLPEAELPEVNFSDYGDIRYLHLGTQWVQGSMLLDKPFDIELEYVQRMMVWLLLAESGPVAARHAMQLGLGSAALTKFCYKKLKMKTTAIELNPQVLAACRLWFKLPADDLRLKVILADAAQEIRIAAKLSRPNLHPLPLGGHQPINCVELRRLFPNKALAISHHGQRGRRVGSVISSQQSCLAAAHCCSQTITRHRGDFQVRALDKRFATHIPPAAIGPVRNHSELLPSPRVIQHRVDREQLQPLRLGIGQLQLSPL